ADEELGLLQTVPPRQRSPQRRRAPIGIEVDAAGFPRDGRHRARRRAEGVLVGGEPDEVGSPELGGQRLKGGTGVVDREPVEDGPPESPHARHSSKSASHLTVFAPGCYARAYVRRAVSPGPARRGKGRAHRGPAPAAARIPPAGARSRVRLSESQTRR